METQSLRPLHRLHESALSSLVIHNVVVDHHRTSVRLEPVMWDSLRDIAHRLQVTTHDLVTEINRERTASSLTAAIRVYIVDFYRAAALLVGEPQSVRPIPIPVRNADC
jgi:predicted DNA-binding ribbon-helix-helix protein